MQTEIWRGVKKTLATSLGEVTDQAQWSRQGRGFSVPLAQNLACAARSGPAEAVLFKSMMAYSGPVPN
jgi:hypothetical protein